MPPIGEQFRVMLANAGDAVVPSGVFKWEDPERGTIDESYWTGSDPRLNWGILKRNPSGDTKYLICFAESANQGGFDFGSQTKLDDIVCDWIPIPNHIVVRVVERRAAEPTDKGFLQKVAGILGFGKEQKDERITGLQVTDSSSEEQLELQRQAERISLGTSEEQPSSFIGQPSYDEDDPEETRLDEPDFDIQQELSDFAFIPSQQLEEPSEDIQEEISQAGDVAEEQTSWTDDIYGKSTGEKDDGFEAAKARFTQEQIEEVKDIDVGPDTLRVAAKPDDDPKSTLFRTVVGEGAEEKLFEAKEKLRRIDFSDVKRVGRGAARKTITGAGKTLRGATTLGGAIVAGEAAGIGAVAGVSAGPMKRGFQYGMSILAKKGIKPLSSFKPGEYVKFAAADERIGVSRGDLGIVKYGARGKDKVVYFPDTGEIVYPTQMTMMEPSGIAPTRETSAISPGLGLYGERYADKFGITSLDYTNGRRYLGGGDPSQIAGGQQRQGGLIDNIPEEMALAWPPKNKQDQASEDKRIQLGRMYGVDIDPIHPFSKRRNAVHEAIRVIRSRIAQVKGGARFREVERPPRGRGTLKFYIKEREADGHKYLLVEIPWWRVKNINPSGPEGWLPLGSLSNIFSAEENMKVTQEFMKLPGGRDPAKDIEYISSVQREDQGRLSVEESGVIGLTDIEAEILTGRASGMPDIIYYTQEERTSTPSAAPQPEPVGASASSSAPAGASRGRGRPRSERTPTRGRTVPERGAQPYMTDRGTDFSVNPQGEAEDISAPQEGQGPFPGDEDNGNGSGGVSGLDNLNLGI